MGFEIVVLPQPVDGAAADLLGSRHRAATPMSRTFWLGMKSRLDHARHLVLIISWFAPAPGPRFPYPIESICEKALAPQRRGVPIDFQLGSNFQILFTCGCHQQNTGAQHDLLRSELGSNPFLQLFSIDFGQDDSTRDFWHRPRVWLGFPICLANCDTLH